MNQCLICKETKPIIFHYWEKEFGSIDLCLDCTLINMPEEADNISECNQCNNPFQKKNDWQKICTSCCIKNKGDLK